MNRYGLLGFIVLLFLSQGQASYRMAAARQGADLPRENPLSVLFRQDPTTEFRNDLEGRMITVSLIMALLALGVAVPTLVWCKRLRESVTRLRASLPSADTTERMADVVHESKALQARVDQLSQNRQANDARFESVVRQLETRIGALEQRFNDLGMVSKDLDSLRDFRDQVRRIHAGIVKAFNGTQPGTPSAMLREEESPGVDA